MTENKYRLSRKVPFILVRF